MKQTFLEKKKKKGRGNSPPAKGERRPIVESDQSRCRRRNKCLHLTTPNRRAVIFDCFRLAIAAKRVAQGAFHKHSTFRRVALEVEALLQKEHPG